MSKINLLDSSVYNRIAAGEVVQQPSSVVKELLENSIDSGATEITIEICDGGLKEICVKDNGCGMSEEDLKKAFLPHATSKVKSVEDLDSISTLGFRGEALASIASVSHVEAYTKPADSDTGVKIAIRGGDFSDTEIYSCPEGTVISVRNLFFNTPARAKFLRKPYQEEADITAVVQKTAFSNPFLSFTYIVDGKLLYKTSGEGLLSTIKAIYGIDFAEASLSVDYQKANVTVKGYVCKPTFTKPNRNYQTVIINGRYVKDFAISASVSNAFGERLMKRTFPIFILDVVMPFADVDVNVHPAKTEVRFKKPSEIYGAIYNAVKNALVSEASLVGLGISDLISKEEIYDSTAQNATFNIKKEENAEKPKETVTPKSLFDAYLGETKEDKYSESSGIDYTLIQKLLDSDKGVPSTKSSKFDLPETKTIAEQTKIQSLESDVKILGQVFECYILAQVGDNLLIMDQHAAHERLIYDELIKTTNDRTIAAQPLLLPYVRTFQPKEFERISDVSEELSNLGFEIEEFGRNTIKVSAVPMLLSRIKFDEFFDGFLSDFDQRTDFTYADLLKEKLAMRACRSAIKAGDSLANTEIVSIINRVIETNMTLQCPHGRPIAIKYSKKDFEKLFKRIV